MNLIKRLLAKKCINGNRLISFLSIIPLVALLSLISSSALGAVLLPATDAPVAADITWQPPIVVDGAPSYNFMTNRSLAYKSDNTPCVVFGGDQLHYSCWDAENEKWDTIVVKDEIVELGEVPQDSSLEGAYASLAFDEFDNPYISYYDAENDILKLAYNVGEGWNKIEVDDKQIDEDSSLIVCPAKTEVDGVVVDSLPQVDGLDTRFDTMKAGESISPELQALNSLIDNLTSDNLINNPLQNDVVAAIEAESDGVGKHTSIAIDHLGGVHISYYNEGCKDLKYAFWNGSSWMTETVDYYNDQGGLGTYTSIAVDSYKDVHIAYMSEKYDDLKYAYKRGGTWRLDTVDGATSNVGTFASIALQEVLVSSVLTPIPNISYLDFSNYNLKFARMNVDKSWSKSSLDSTDRVGLFTSIAMDPDGKIWISYYDSSNGNLKYARYASGSWSVKTIYSDGNIGLYTSIAIDSNYLPGIIFGDALNNTLHYTHLTDGKWIANSLGVGSISDVGLYSSLALSYFGQPYIAYRDETAGMLKLAYNTSGDWEGGWNTNVITNTIHAGTYSSISMFSPYVPWVAFYDETNKDLILGKWNSFESEWDFQSVAGIDDVGRYVSLAIDSSGDPHLSYYDATYGDLMYSYWDSTTNVWKTTRVDAADDVGYFSSLTLDEGDHPYISYYDKTNEQIKYAYYRIPGGWNSFPLVEVGLEGDDEELNDAYSSIALSNGKPRIAFYSYNNSSTIGDLKIAVASKEYPVESDWNISTVDSGGDVDKVNIIDMGKYVSMVIEEGTDIRHICYYDATDGDLEYAYWNSPDPTDPWDLESLDEGGDVGKYCSIALDGEGRPAISYYDAYLGNLKFVSSYSNLLESNDIFLPAILR